MIPVTPQPEPEDFDTKVRQKGLRWLAEHDIDITDPLPSRTKLPPYWRACLDELHSRYGGVCAYLAVFFERTTGGTVEHFCPKSLRPDFAYEWCNYRLACSAINSRKKSFTDVLDPFEVKDGWFCLELVSGHIFPNPQLPASLQQKIQATIDRLKLDSSANNEMRAKHYQFYCKGEVTKAFLKKYSPFVWKEAARQGLL
ncbi:hypothetical protein B5F76_13440 [Desulfovibrio sp. An276]|uniref:hypothetical protein n=1 Tax=Desulfovibrio sp. An276 TaxID=1965618 RepID=UPI000B393F90|nr:hypothetical protein [Desulfovibrio sp. An276]OUO49681.1 hypothetical protein B5F76_13440 [Desulfovibrio sp. An276]